MSTLVRLRPGAVEWREVDGELIVLDMRASTYFAVNRTGAAIWPDLVAGASRAELESRLMDSFGVDQEIAARDVDAFLGQIGERGLLES